MGSHFFYCFLLGEDALELRRKNFGCLGWGVGRAVVSKWQMGQLGVLLSAFLFREGDRGSSEEEYPRTHSPGFLRLSMSDVLDRITLCCGGQSCVLKGA